MPFDSTNFLTETKPDVFSLAGLIAWLETQDPRTEYSFSSLDGTCLLDTYLTAQGVPCGAGRYCRLADIKISPSPEWQEIMEGTPYTIGIVACEFPHTYGAALERARISLQSETKGA